MGTRIPVPMNRLPELAWVASIMQKMHGQQPKGGASPPAEGARDRPGTLNEEGIVFGISYESDAVLPDETEPLIVANRVTDYIPNARREPRASCLARSRW